MTIKKRVGKRPGRNILPYPPISRLFSEVQKKIELFFWSQGESNKLKACCPVRISDLSFHDSLGHLESTLESSGKKGNIFFKENIGNISKGTQNTNVKEHKHPYIHCSVIYNHQDMEAAQVSISR